MTTAGPNNAGTAVSNNAAGTSLWGSPSNVTGASNGTYSGFDAESSGDSEYLDVTNFGFSIPSGATGISFTFEVNRRENNSSDNIFDKAVYFLKNGSAVSSNVKNASELPTSFAYASYLSSSDTNGTSWLYSDINNSGFGIRIQMAESVGNNINAEGRVEHVRCTVTYTSSGGTVTSVQVDRHALNRGMNRGMNRGVN